MDSKRKFGLPEFAEIESSPRLLPEEEEISRAQRRSPQERAQTMWLLFQDLKRSWRQFQSAHNVEIDKKNAGKKSEEEKEAHLPFSFERLFDAHEPIAKQFHPSPTFKSSQPRLHALYTVPEVRAAWEEGMQVHAKRWEGINGTWTEYRALEKDRAVVEKRYDELQKEKFDERAKPVKDRRRMLDDDRADVELELVDLHLRKEALRRSSPELAAKILASELEERRKELQVPGGFMWFESRRRMLEVLEAKIAENETLRLIVLEGQAGTGKTTFARALARIFTGHDPFEFRIKARTKVDRQLLTDETLDPAHPTVYRSILEAITGKKRPEDAPAHDGRVAFADELNSGENDEIRDLATVLDGMRAGGKTGYRDLGANPEDIVQPKALVIAAQNPAGARFLGRTKFTPEVARKLDKVPLDYFSQTPENPELFEAFLVALKDADGRNQQNRREISPAWTRLEDETIEEEKDGSGHVVSRFKQQKLRTTPDAGGALWRLSQMLHQSYENLSKRKNDLTDANPDAHIQGRVLPPGDVITWLKLYNKEMKKGRPLEGYLSEKFMDWIESSFTEDHDQEDKRLYLELAARYGIVFKEGSRYRAHILSNEMKMDLLTPRDVAELSPRVPRKKEYVGARIETPEFTRAVIDWTAPDGMRHERVQVRYEETRDDGKKFSRPGLSGLFRVVGIIRECDAVPELIGKTYYKKVEATPPTPDLPYTESEARRLKLERVEIKGNQEAQRLIDQVINGTLDIETPAGQKQFIDTWNAHCPNLPPPCVPPDDFWYLTKLKNKKIISNLEGTPAPTSPHWNHDQVLLIDSWEETNYDAPDAKTKHTSPLLKELMGNPSTVNIKREDLDSALWLGDPSLHIPTPKHKALLIKLGADPQTSELRPIRQDEYARLANTKGFGKKNLWTNFDHYSPEGDDARRGLLGGYRGRGGPSRVGSDSRGYARDGLAVRLVLARK